MKPIWFVMLLLMIILWSDLSSANGDLVTWRWRNDNGSVYTATWKDSVNTPVLLNQHGNFRLRISLPMDSKLSSRISLRYSENPTDSRSWIPITHADTGKFIISPSPHLVDTLSYSDNQLLPVATRSGEQALPYRKTITIDSSASCLVSVQEPCLYELEFSLKPTSKTQPGSAYFFWLFRDSTVWDYWITPEFPCLLIPPAANWSRHSIGTYTVLQDVSFVDANTGTVVGRSAAGGGGEIFRTVDGGKTWMKLSLPTNNALYGVDFADRNVGIAVGSSGAILRTTDSGENWFALMTSPGNHLRSIDFFDDKIGTIVGGNAIGAAVVLRTTTGGESWFEQPCPSGRALWSVCLTSAEAGTAVGERGTILRTTNGGQYWFAQASGTTAHLESVCFADSNNGAAVGFLDRKGIILHTTDGGTTWCQSADLGAPHLRSVCFAGRSTGWAVGDKGWILKTDDGGVNWQRQISGAYWTLYAVDFIDAQTGWIVGGDGTIIKATKSVNVSSVDGRSEDSAPRRFVLWQNYPNPFNPNTAIKYELPKASLVRLSVHDLLGRKVMVLIDEWRDAGVHVQQFDGSGLSSGIYFYRIRAGDFTQSKRLVLLK